MATRCCASPRFAASDRTAAMTGPCTAALSTSNYVTYYDPAKATETQAAVAVALPLVKEFEGCRLTLLVAIGLPTFRAARGTAGELSRHHGQWPPW